MFPFDHRDAVRLSGRAEVVGFRGRQFVLKRRVRRFGFGRRYALGGAR